MRIGHAQRRAKDALGATGGLFAEQRSGVGGTRR
jgi:hypothetical protein